MARSQKTFERWQPHDKSTWSFQLFQRYNRELEDIWHAHWIAMKSVYKSLGTQGVTFADPPGKALTGELASITRYKTIGDWSDGINAFDNWTSLNVLLSIASNLETYLASVISLSLESDPGVVFGASKSVDGAAVVKNRSRPFQGFSTHLNACVMGEWSSRFDALEKLFGNRIQPLRNYHAALERMRTLRNKVGHAFGRDIDEARRHGVLKKIPMERLSRSSADNTRRRVYAFAKSIDSILLSNHIGDYEPVRFYQTAYSNLNKQVNQGQRAANFKKMIGKFGAIPRGKIYCNGLVRYWEGL